MNKAIKQTCPPEKPEFDAKRREGELTSRLPQKLRVLTSLLLITFLFMNTGQAVQRIWENSGTEFNADVNWTTDVAPGEGDVAVFNTAALVQPELSAGRTIAGLFFLGSGASGYDFTSAFGNSLGLTGSSTSGAGGSSNGNAAAIRAENTSGSNTITVKLSLQPNTGDFTTSTFFQAAGGTLIVNETVGGFFGTTLSLRGGGAIELNNTVGANVSIDTAGQVLVLGSNNNLGGNMLSVKSAATIMAGGGNRSNNSSVVLAGNTTFAGTDDLTFTESVTSSGSASRSLTVSNNTFLNGSVFLAPDQTVARGLTINGTGNLEINGVMANNSGDNAVGSSFIVNNPGGAVTLNGANTYTGPTTLTAGNVVLGNKSAFGGSAVAWNNISASASTDLSGANAITNTSTIGGNPTFTGANSIELSGRFPPPGTARSQTTSSVARSPFPGLLISRAAR